MDVIYLDFVICHGMIYHNLRGLSINEKLSEWLYNLLKDRGQDVAANRALFRGTPITSGMPQRTVLGLLLFEVALSDMLAAAKAATFTC